MDPREYYQGSLKRTLKKYLHIGKTVPAMGYSAKQVPHPGKERPGKATRILAPGTDHLSLVCQAGRQMPACVTCRLACAQPCLPLRPAQTWTVSADPAKLSMPWVSLMR